MQGITSKFIAWFSAKVHLQAFLPIFVNKQLFFMILAKGVKKNYIWQLLLTDGIWRNLTQTVSVQVIQLNSNLTG